MSVKVNLLPSQVSERNRRSRQLAAAGGGAVVLLAILGGVWFWKNSQVDDAREELAAEQEVVSELQGEVAELSEFAALQASLQNADEDVALILGGEIGAAGILQDLAAVMPTDTELSDLSITVTPDAETGEIGILSANGRTTNRHAPGLERLLLELDKVAAFYNPYFGSAAVDNDDAVAFDVTVELGSEVTTGRYADGIPEVLR